MEYIIIVCRMVLNLLLRSLFSDIDNSFDIDSHSENVYNYTVTDCNIIIHAFQLNDVKV